MNTTTVNPKSRLHRMPLEPALATGDGVPIWKEAERAEIRAELDAAYFHLYGVERADAETMLSTFTNTGLAPEDKRGSRQGLWKAGSTGEMVLTAFDRLGKS
jgi:hypothetical protein